MTIITSQEINQFRSALANNQEALEALQILEECDGNLEDAIEVIVIESSAEEISRGEGFGSGSDFLEQLAQRCRNIICQEDFKSEFIDGFSADFLNTLVSYVMANLVSLNLPAGLAVALVMYLLRRGIRRFCEENNDTDSENEQKTDNKDTDSENKQKTDNKDTDSENEREM